MVRRFIYSSPNTTWLVKSDEIGRCVAFIGDRRAMYRLWWGNLKERGHLDSLGIDARIILKGTLKNSGCA